MLKCYKRSVGFTLVDIIIALAIGVVVLGGAISLYNYFILQTTRSIQLLNLKMELYTAVDYMVTELKRAGYWNQFAVGAPGSNPFNAAAYTIIVNAGGDCISFAYDKNGDGQLPAIGTSPQDERFVFRLSSNVVQIRTPNASFSCTANTGWQNLTDTSLLNVTALNFTLTATNVVVNAHTTNVLRAVTITMTGVSPSNASVTSTITRTVKIRNNYILAT